MEQKQGCSSCKRKKFELTESEKTLSIIAAVIIFLSIYGIVSLVNDIISIF